MEQSTKKKIAIGVSLTILLGVGGYFLFKFLKAKKEEKDKAKADADAALLAEQQKQTKSQGDSKPATQSQIANPFKTTDDIKKFQDWMDLKNPNWVNGKNLNKGGGYGSYGPSTQKAWKDYGTAYTTSTAAVVTTPTTPAPVKPTGVNIYANKVGTPIWDNVNDVTPYRMAGSGEGVGTTDGTIEKSYLGNSFYKLNYAGKTKYIAVENASFKK